MMRALMSVFSLAAYSAAAVISGVPHLQEEFSLWQWSSPVVAPDANHIPPVQFASAWHFDGPNKRLLLRTGSPNSTSFVLHVGNVAPAKMYYYDTAKRTCAHFELPIGPPRPDWLSGHNGTRVTDTFLRTASGDFVRTDLWCKPDVPGWTPFCSYWAGNTLLRLTAPPGGPGVPGDHLILNEYTRYSPGPQPPSLFAVPAFCDARSPADPHRLPDLHRTLPYPYTHSLEDAARAVRPKPRPALRADTGAAVAAVLNRHLPGARSRECEAFSFEDLNELRAAMATKLAGDFDALYAAARDRRVRRVADPSEDEAERRLIGLHAAAPDDHTAAVVATVRAGKCAELVMWFIHHLPAPHRAAWPTTIPRLSLRGLGPFPSIPADHPAASAAPVLERRYREQSSCLHCHFQPGPGADSTA